MRRQDLEHVLGAAANISGETEFVVVGSQAILGSYPSAPDDLLRSMEADIYPKDSPEKAVDIEGSLGDGSSFHQTHGFYAQGVGPETAKPPEGWQARLVKMDVRPRPGTEGKVVAYCLEVHDLVLSKLVAGRERDWEFAQDALRVGIVDADVLVSRIDALPVSGAKREYIRRMLGGIRQST